MKLSKEQVARLNERVEYYRTSKEVPDLLEMTRYIFDNKMLDGRSNEGKAVKIYLQEKKIDFSTRKPKSRSVILTEKQEDFIRNNIKHGLSYLDVARILFEDPKLNNLHAESRAVLNFINAIQPGQGQVKQHTQTNHTAEDGEDFEQDLNIIVPSMGNDFIKEEYKPPKTIDQTLARLRKYVSISEWKRENLKEKDIKRVEALMRYMNTIRFLYQIGTYVRVGDRELFEDSFIRYTYDKEDLLQEEIDQYVILCTEIVIGTNVLRRVESLNILLDNQASSDENGQKIKMSLNDAINTVQGEYNACITRQNKLYDILIGKRNDRAKEFDKENGVLTNLVKAWKDEEYRVKMLRYGQMEDAKLKEEASRLMGVDAIKALIRGISIDEVING